MDKFDTYFKVGLMIMAIFGIAGGWGLNALTRANALITSLQTNIMTLQGNITIIQSNVTSLQTSVTNLSNQAGQIEGRFVGIDRELTNRAHELTDGLDASARDAVTRAIAEQLNSRLLQIKSDMDALQKHMATLVTKAEFSQRTADLDAAQNSAISELKQDTVFVFSNNGQCPSGFALAGLLLGLGEDKLYVSGYGAPTAGGRTTGQSGWPYMHSGICKRQ